MGKKTFDKIDISSIPLPDVEALSVEAVDKKFNLKASGSEDGSRCEPRSDAQSQSAFEIKIGAYFSQHMSQIKARFQDRERPCREGRTRLRTTLNLQNDINTMEQVPQEANMVWEQKYQIKANEINRCTKALDKKRTNYRVFQVNNNLTDRDPQYHTDWKKYYLLVLIFAFVEFVIGVGFFIQADSIAVSKYAAATVAVNVLLALFAGDRWRFQNHVIVIKKITGLSIAIFTLALFVGLMIAVAHLRMAIPLAVEEVLKGTAESVMFPAIKLAGDSLFSNPFSFVKDVTAIIFIGFTYAFGIYAFLKGYGYQDEYPGYSRKLLS